MKLFNHLDCLLDMALDEAVIKTSYDDAYMGLLKEVQKLPWDAKPRTGKSSAINQLWGNIKGVSYTFEWHRPDTKWGPEWNFLGLFADSKSMFDKTASDLMSANHKVQKEAGFAAPTGAASISAAQKNLFDHDMQKKNLKEFEDAVAYVRKMGV